MERRCTTIEGFDKRFTDEALKAEDMLKDVEAKAKIGHNTLFRWRIGEDLPTTRNLVRFCRAYNVSMDYLLGLSDRRERR
jgi:transcriptional regulator with XRE-family HTH domain